MIKTFYTPAGIIERELTQEELIAYARAGDTVCRIEVLKKVWSTLTAEQKVKAVARLLALETW